MYKNVHHRNKKEIYSNRTQTPALLQDAWNGRSRSTLLTSKVPVLILVLPPKWLADGYGWVMTSC